MSAAIVRESGPKDFGQYVLHEELGRGGMAVVHLAESRKPGTEGRMVALKRLLPNKDFDRSVDMVRTFVEEARLATRFHHRNIVETYSLGKIDGSYFIAMEYVPGPTLLQIATQCQTTGQIPLQLVLQIVIQICDALDHVHNVRGDDGKPLGIVHRDVSLSNIIVSHAGIVKLIDFGVAKGRTSHVQTKAGMIKGKFGYVAPEYLAGRLDTRADLFAVGVIAHELLAGRRLFQGLNDLDTITRLRDMPIPLPSIGRPDVSPELDDIVMLALARDPDQRWQTAHAMRTALANVLAELGPATPNELGTWVDWSFSQDARDRQLTRVIDGLETDHPTMTIAPESLVASEPAPVSAVPAVIVGSGLRWKMAVLVTMLAGGALAFLYAGQLS